MGSIMREGGKGSTGLLGCFLGLGAKPGTSNGMIATAGWVGLGRDGIGALCGPTLADRLVAGAKAIARRLCSTALNPFRFPSLLPTPPTRNKPGIFKIMPYSPGVAGSCGRSPCDTV